LTGAINEPELAIVDVGHGSSVVLHGDRTVIVDAGPGGALLEYCTGQNITTVSTIILTHADSDHIKGLIGLLASDTISIGTVLLNSDSLKKSVLWADLIYELDDLRRRGALEVELGLIEGKKVAGPGDHIEVEIIAPRLRLAGAGAGARDRSGGRIDSNTMSAVVRVRIDEEPQVLIASDLDAVGFGHLVDAGVDLYAPLLVFPHHGGNVRPGASESDNRAFTRALISAVRPQCVVFSIGRGRNATPRPEIVDEIKSVDPGVRFLCTQLSEHCAGDLPQNDESHLLNRFALGRSRRACCAGTVVLRLVTGLDVGARVGPTLDDHAAFILRVAPAALCGRARE
jgi:competence protein ComEC